MAKVKGPKEAQDLAKSALTNPEVLHDLADSEFDFVKVALVENPTTLSKTLAELIPQNLDSFGEQQIAVGLAKNPKTPPETLGALATRLSPHMNGGRDNKLAFGAGVALCVNPLTPFVALKEAISGDSVSTEFRKVAARESRRRDVLDFLAQDRSETVRRRAELSLLELSKEAA